MKILNKKRKIIYLVIIFLFIIIGVCVVTRTYPVVFINGKAYWGLITEFNSPINLDSSKNLANDDVNDIQKLRWLKKINLSLTNITDVSFLSNMKDLRYAVFRNNSQYIIENFEYIKNCKRLEEFNGSNLGITSLDVFKGSTELKRLWVETITANNSKITDISDVKYLVNLEDFAVCGRGITDISELKNCTKLKYLSLRFINATNYSILFELPNLEFLDIDKGALNSAEITKLKEKGIEVYEW